MVIISLNIFLPLFIFILELQLYVCITQVSIHLFIFFVVSYSFNFGLCLLVHLGIHWHFLLKYIFFSYHLVNFKKIKCFIFHVQKFHLQTFLSFISFLNMIKFSFVSLNIIIISIINFLRSSPAYFIFAVLINFSSIYIFLLPYFLVILFGCFTPWILCFECCIKKV